MLDLFPSLSPEDTAAQDTARYERIMHYGFTLAGGEYRPYWILVDLSGGSRRQRKVILQEGQKVILGYGEERYCTGRYDLLAEGLPLSPCPRQAKLGPKKQSSQCIACSKATGFYAAFDTVPVEELSLQQQAYNRFPHDVYLAYFAPGVIKVGISCHSRLEKRWLEQGARAACLLQAMPDAYAARELEKKSGRIGVLGKGI